MRGRGASRGLRGSRGNDSQQRKRKNSGDDEVAKRPRTSSATNNDTLGGQVGADSEQSPPRTLTGANARPATPHPMQPSLSSTEGGNNDF